MAINNLENESMTANEPHQGVELESEMPTSIEEVVEKFADPVELTSAEEITSFFENNLNKNRLCITIPVTIEDEATRGQELCQIGVNLRRAIFRYTCVEMDSAIGPSLLGLIGEATSDIAKHTVIGDRFNKIMVLVTKNNLDVSFHLVNPARSDTDLHRIRQEDSSDEYQTEAHGYNLSAGLEKDLLNYGCPSVTDESHLVQTGGKETVAFERDISIELPN